MTMWRRDPSQTSVAHVTTVKKKMKMFLFGIVCYQSITQPSLTYPNGHSRTGILHWEGFKKAYLLPCEVNCTRNTDDEKADNDGGNGHPLGIPPKPPGSFDISIVVAVQRLGDTREE